MITIDTLRADHVGAYGATTAATPVLDALAARGVRFDQVQTAVPLTGPSHATILTGQYPPSHGVRGNVVFTLGDKHPTLATRMKRRGYRTALAGMTLPNDASVGLHRALGFEPVGTFRRVGYKHGAWHDVAWAQIVLTGGDEPPTEPD